MERRLLQIAVALTGCFPVAIGLAGVLIGSRFISVDGSPELDGAFRNLSGILLAAGVWWWASIWNIERHGERFSTIAFIFFAGSLARLYGLVVYGTPTVGAMISLGMGLIVIPLIWLWQRHMAAHYVSSRTVRGDLI